MACEIAKERHDLDDTISCPRIILASHGDESETRSFVVADRAALNDVGKLGRSPWTISTWNVGFTELDGEDESLREKREREGGRERGHLLWIITGGAKAPFNAPTRLETWYHGRFRPSFLFSFHCYYFVPFLPSFRAK